MRCRNRLDESHPDRKGEQLRSLAPIFKAFAKEAKVNAWGGGKVGVFIDYTALPQRSLASYEAGGEDDRTPAEKATFGRALKALHAWYAHRMTHVLLVDTVRCFAAGPRQGVSSHWPLARCHPISARSPAMLCCTQALPSGSTNTQPYEGRGWCWMEDCASSLVKDDTALIRMSKLTGEETDYFQFVKNGKSDRAPPRPPAPFANEPFYETLGRRLLGRNYLPGPSK